MIHGQKRVNMSDLQKQEMREKKLQTIEEIKNLMKSIEVEREDIHSNLDSLLDKTSKVLAFDPNKQSIWSLRKDMFIQIRLKRRSEFIKYIEKEIEFIKTRCLPIDPKSYSTWYHIKYLIKIVGIDKLNFRVFLDLTEQFFTKDDRNFHCWNFRRFILSLIDSYRKKSISSSENKTQGSSSAIKSQNKGLTNYSHNFENPKDSELIQFDTVENELSFTERLIRKNFSNYSAWHHRSLYIKYKLLLNENENFKNIFIPNLNNHLVKTSFDKNIDTEVLNKSDNISNDALQFQTNDLETELLTNNSSQSNENYPKVDDLIAIIQEINNFSMMSEQSLHYTNKSSDNSSNNKKLDFLISNSNDYSSYLINLDLFKYELDMIHDALFTSPKDQSIWTYYKLVLDIVFDSYSKIIPLFISTVKISTSKNLYKMSVTLSKETKEFPSHYKFFVKNIDSSEFYIQLDWKPSNNMKSSNWYTIIDVNKININDDAMLLLNYNKESDYLAIFINSRINFTNNLRNSPDYNFLKKSVFKKTSVISIIVSSYEMIKELLKYEPQNNFILLFLSEIEVKLNFLENFSSIIKYLNVLIHEDTDRIGYYKYKKSQYIFLERFFKLANCGSQNIIIDVSHMSIFTIPDVDLLFHVTYLILTGNKEINDLDKLKFCLNLEQLICNQCSVKSLKSLINLKSLYKVELNHNNVVKLDQIIDMFTHLHFQLEISLMHNPICVDEKFYNVLKSLATRPVLLNGELL